MHIAVKELLVILIRLDDAAHTQDVDVRSEAGREAAGYALAAEFREGVCVCRVDVEVFVDGEGGKVDVSLGEGDAVDGGAAGDDEFGDAELACCFDDVVGGYCVGVSRYLARTCYAGCRPCELRRRREGVCLEGRAR